MNNGMPFAFALCCLWPLVCIGIYEFVKRGITQRDWTRINWRELRFPWSKHD